MVSARCPLLRCVTVHGTSLRDESRGKHVDLALRLLGAGRRLWIRQAEGCQDVRERILQDVHPLHLELSKTLVALFCGCAHMSDVGEVGHLGNGDIPWHRLVEASKSELRAMVVQRLEEVLTVLHTPPSPVWALPPPPASAGQEGVVDACNECAQRT